MSLIPSVARAVLVPWSVSAAILSSSSACVLVGGAVQRAELPARASPRACRLIPVSTVRPVVEKAMERSETIRRQCQELAAARAVVVLEWGAMDSQSDARTAMEVRAGVVVASVKLPPLGDIIVLMAHELQHVIEQTRSSQSPRRGKTGRVRCLAVFSSVRPRARSTSAARSPRSCARIQGRPPAARMTASLTEARRAGSAARESEVHGRFCGVRLLDLRGSDRRWRHFGVGIGQ